MKYIKLYESESSVNTNYDRVIPRDLFNEAKLLKCIGQLCLMIHNNTVPVEMSFEREEDGSPFEIGLTDDGSLTIVNLTIFIKNVPCAFHTTHNSKSNFPLYLEHDRAEYLVFDDNGKFDKEFIDICNKIN